MVGLVFGCEYGMDMDMEAVMIVYKTKTTTRDVSIPTMFSVRYKIYNRSVCPATPLESPTHDAAATLAP